MASKQPSHTTQTTEVKLPAWVDAASQENYDFAKQVADKPFVPYDGQMVADTSDLTKQAQGILASGALSDQTGFNAASGLFNQAAGGSAYTGQAADIFSNIANGGGFAGNAADMAAKMANGSAYTGEAADILRGLTNPTQYATDAAALYNKAGQGINGLNRADYMNPFTDSVINNTVSRSQDALQQSLMGNADKAVAAKAFGGDRSAIVDAVSTAQSNKDLSSLIAQLNSDNYNQATSAMQGDISSMLGAAGGLSGLNSSDISARTAAGSGIAGLGANEMAGWGNAANIYSGLSGQQLSSASGLAGLGSQQVNDWLAAASGLSSNQTAANKDKLQEVSGLLTAGAQDQQNTQAQLDAARSEWDREQNHDLDSLNMRLSALGMSPYGQSQTTNTTQTGGSSGTDFGTLGLGLLSMLFGISDERLKKNKVKVGTKIVRGKKVPIYKYHYVGESPQVPKHRGPMAQDLEKAMPEAVANVGGIKMVDKKVLGALAR